jgi:hypothetical protein
MQEAVERERKNGQEQLNALEAENAQGPQSRFRRRSYAGNSKECSRLRSTTNAPGYRKRCAWRNSASPRRLSGPCGKNSKRNSRMSWQRNVNDGKKTPKRSLGCPGVAPSQAVPGIERIVTGIAQEISNPMSAVLNTVKLIKIKTAPGSEPKSKEYKSAIE